MKPLYSSDKSRIIGYFVNGKIIPPALEGTALDVLVDQIAETIEKYFGHFRDKDMGKELDRLDGQLKPREGTHSRLLLDGIHQWDSQNKFTRGVRSWVTEGTLRSCDELTSVLREFVAARQLERRMHPERVPADWKINDYDLAVIGAEFGLPAPPTPEQLAAEAAECRKQEDERRRKDAEGAEEERARLAAWEKEHEIKARKKRLLESISHKFFTMDDLTSEDFGENTSEAYKRAYRLRFVFQEVYRRRINMRVDEGWTDEAIFEEMTMMNEKGFSGFGGEWRSAPLPTLEEGENRRFFMTPSEVVAYYGTSEAQTLLDSSFKFSTQLGMDGRWAVSILRKTEDDLTREAAIDAESAQ